MTYNLEVKSICMVIPRFLPVVGGTEKQCWLLSRELVKRGFRILILTQREKGTPFLEIKEGVKIYRLPGLFLPFFPSFGFFFSAIAFLLIFNKKYEIIHVHLATSLIFLAVIMKCIFKKRIVVKLGASGRYGDIFTSSLSLFRRAKPVSYTHLTLPTN